MDPIEGYKMPPLQWNPHVGSQQIKPVLKRAKTALVVANARHPISSEADIPHLASLGIGPVVQVGDFKTPSGEDRAQECQIQYSELGGQTTQWRSMTALPALSVIPSPSCGSILACGYDTALRSSRLSSRTGAPSPACSPMETKARRSLRRLWLVD
jgi:hypothetical protein